jgi:hypothetical protein
MKSKQVLREEYTSEAMRIKNEIGIGDGFEDSSPFGTSSDITVRFVELDGLVRLMLEIGVGATHKELRKAIPSVLKWRDQLQEKQYDKIADQLLHSMRNPFNKEETLEMYSYFQENGTSYAKLAERINSIAVRYLREILSYRQKRRLSADDVMEEKLLWTHVGKLLDTVGIKDVDLKDALAQLAHGEPPFQKGKPVSRYKMIEVLRYWRKSRLHFAARRAFKQKSREYEQEWWWLSVGKT